MKTEAKELIQEGLKLFSLYDRRALKRFYLSAEKSEADLSYLDEKTYHISMKSIRLICVLKQEDCFLIF